MTNSLQRFRSLAHLGEGEAGVLSHFSLEECLTARLKRLGLTPGRQVTLLKRGPRCILASAGARFALDLKLVSQIFIDSSPED